MQKSIVVLSYIYEHNTYPNLAELKDIADRLHLTLQQVRTWVS